MNLPWIEFGASLLLPILCIPLILRKVPKNDWYGVRTTRSMNGTDEDWYTVNHDGGIILAVSGLASAAVDVVVAFLPLGPLTAYIIATAALMLAAVGPLLFFRKRIF